MRNSRRSDIEIIGEILRMDGAGKTEIMYGVNMSHAQLQRYVDLLLNRGLLQKSEQDSKPRYRATEKGKELLQTINKVREILQ